MALTCLNTLVGLSKTEFECFSDDAPEGFDTSTSGYHLTDPDYGLAVIDQCQLAGWTMLQTAKAQAILEVQNELRAILREKYPSSFIPFTGEVGKRKSTGVIQMRKDKAGIRILVPRQRRDMYFVLKEIWLGLDTSGSKSLVFDSNDDLFSQAGLSVACVADTFVKATQDGDIEIPLWTETELDDHLQYFISTDVNGENPLNNVIECCGSSPSWKSTLNIAGFQSDVTAPASGSFSTYAHGFILKGYLKCNELDWICSAEELAGFHLKDVLARTIQFRGAAIAHSMLVETLKVNPCTGYNLEAMYAKRASLNKRSSENLHWLGENITDGLSGCFKCKPENFFKSKIIRT
jgi:hypothetical protein